MDDCHCPDKIGVCLSSYQTTDTPEAVSLGGVIFNDPYYLLSLVCDLVTIFIAFCKAGIEPFVVCCIITLLIRLRIMLQPGRPGLWIFRSRGYCWVVRFFAPSHQMTTSASAY